MKRDQKQRPDNKRGFPGLLLLFIVGLVVILAFQNLSESRMASVSFSHQIEHLVNLDLLEEGQNRKTSLNENLVSFSGKFRDNLTESAKNRYRYLKLLSQHHELFSLKSAQLAELDSSYKDAINSVNYYLLISSTKVPSGGYVVVSKNFDTPDRSNAMIIKEVAKSSEAVVTLKDVREQLAAFSYERSADKSPEKLAAAGQSLSTLISEFRSFRLGIGNEVLKKKLIDAETILNTSFETKGLSFAHRLELYNDVLSRVESVSSQIGTSANGISCGDLRLVRLYQEQVNNERTLSTDYRKNELQLSKARTKVSSVYWYYHNSEISTKELEAKNPEEFQKWYMQSEKEWTAYESNKGLAFRAPDQTKTLALEKAFKTEEPAPNYFSYLFTFMPILLVGLLLYFIFTRQMKGGGSSAMNFGKSPAKMLNKSSLTVTFNEVAGIEEAKEELEEVVEFLKDPSRFKALGARIPKGVLLIGAPGTGKTLLARAVAGEAGVPFFSISGSDFVEMFVGVGASRVRDLFDQARKNAPCIIFIDEIDAVGRHRGSGLGGGHDEREQTLNQLLVEIDGMDSSEGVIIIAATNRPDVLDKALLRPGRFDRSVNVEKPDLKGRLEILKVHALKVKIGENVNLKEVAQTTSGLAGADLENIVNEAALHAARKYRKAVSHEDFRYALEKLLFGKERKSMIMNLEDKVITAWHEAGHAVLSMILKVTDDVVKVTIIPRGQSLGATHFQEKANRVSHTIKEITDKLIVLMGGRVAEEIHNQNPTNGAKGDIMMATAYARAMVTEWGMSKKIGMVSYSDSGQGNLISGFHEKEHSEQTANTIDQEVKGLIDHAYNEAYRILTEHQEKMKEVAEMLLKFETLDREDLEKIMEGNFDSEEKQSKIDKYVDAKRREVPALPKSLRKKQQKFKDSPATG